MSDFVAKMHQIQFRLGLRPRPSWGSLQRSPDPLAGGEGAGCPLPRTPPPLSAVRYSALRASVLGPSGLGVLAPQLQFLKKGPARYCSHCQSAAITRL